MAQPAWDDSSDSGIKNARIHKVIKGSQAILARSPESFATLSEYTWNKVFNFGHNLEQLLSVGFDILPTAKMSKRLKNGIKGGTTYTPEQFDPFDNISIRLGRYEENNKQTSSCHLVDLDLETFLAQTVALFYFRNFGINTPTFGRITAQRNHYLFLVPSSSPHAGDVEDHHIKTKQFYEVSVEASEAHAQSGEMLFELKPSGHVLVPKSWHPSNGSPEQLMWMSNDTELLKIEWHELMAHLGRIATVCRLTEFFIEGNRNNLVFAISSWFAKESVPFEVTYKLLNTLFDVVGTTNQDRTSFVTTVSNVYAQYEVATTDQRSKFGGMTGFIDKISSGAESILRVQQIAEKIRYEMFQIKIISKAQAGDVDIYRVNKNFFLDGAGDTYKYLYRYRGKDVIGIDLIPIKAGNLGNLLNINSKSYYLPPKSAEEKPKKLLLADFWRQHEEALRIEKVVFDPRIPSGFVDVLTPHGIVKNLNKWFGWPIQSVVPSGETLNQICPHIHDYLFHIISDSDKQRYKWLLDLLAFKIQNPHCLTEICLILFGEQHTGKNFFTDFFCQTLLGEHHSKTTGKVSDLLGRFNEDYADRMMVVFHEVMAINARERKAISEELKNFLTNRTISIEAKGVDRVERNNYVQMFITTNNYRNVPIGDDRRRYCLFKIGIREKANNVYFHNLECQIKENEMKYFMHYLLYMHNICGEEMYEEVSNNDLLALYSEANNDPTLVDQFFEKRDQRSTLQLQHLHKTMPILEELQSMQEDQINVSFLDKYDLVIQQCIENTLIFGYFNCHKYHPDRNELINFTAADIREQFYETEYGKSVASQYTRKEISRNIRNKVTRMFAKKNDEGKQLNIFRTETNKEYNLDTNAFRVRRANLSNKSFDQEYNRKHNCLFDDNTFITTSRNVLYSLLNRETMSSDRLEHLDRIFGTRTNEITEDDDEVEAAIANGNVLPTLREVGEYLYGESKWLEIMSNKTKAF